MVEKLPSTHTYLLLGDAYINIQEVKERGNGIHVWLKVSPFFMVLRRSTVSVRSNWEQLKRKRPHI